MKKICTVFMIGVLWAVGANADISQVQAVLPGGTQAATAMTEIVASLPEPQPGTPAIVNSINTLAAIADAGDAAIETAASGGGCGWINFEPRRAANSKDYIWWNSREYNNAVVNDAPAKAAVCRAVKQGGCPKNSTITAPAEHVFGGNMIPYSRTYKCKGQQWEPVGGGDNNGYCPQFRFEAVNVQLAPGEKFPRSSEVTMTKEECQTITGERLTGTRFQVECTQKKTLHCIPLGGSNNDNDRLKWCTVNIKGNTVRIKYGEMSNIDLSADECQRAVSTSSTTDGTKIIGDTEKFVNNFVSNSGTTESSSVGQGAINTASGAASYATGGGASGTSTSTSAAMDVNGIYRFFCGPSCRKVGCRDDYDLDDLGNCVKKKQSCRQQRAGMSEEAKACCDAGRESSWDQVVQGKCVCIVVGSNPKVADPNKEFQIVNGRGQCVPKSGPTPRQCPSDATPSGSTCTCTDTSKRFDEVLWACVPTNCPSDATPSGTTCSCNDPNMNYNEATKLCECSVVENTIKEGNKCVCTEPNKVIKDGKCQISEEYLGKIKIDITASFNRLTSTVGGFKKNVWKDADGNFNTARLASDSIAGIVLGTAGGIITAKIVKKNQLKQGFEDVKCSIGGQNVASYGDDFTVGR